MSTSRPKRITKINPNGVMNKTAMVKKRAPNEKRVTAKKTNTTKKTANEQTATTKQMATTRKTNTTQQIHSNKKENAPRGRKKTINENKRNIILNEYNVNGLTQTKIAAMVGTSQVTVSKILNEQTHSSDDARKPRKKRKLVDEEMRKTILRERNVSGLTQRKIATMVGTSRATVSRILIDHILSTGNTLKPRRKMKTIDENDRKIIMRERHVNGLTHKKIAAIVGTSISTVYKILNEQNLNNEDARKPRKKRKTVDEEMRKTVFYERNVNGLSQKQIAAMIGTSLITVSKILNEKNPNAGNSRMPRTIRKPVDENMRKIILHEHKVNGLNQKQIAAKVGTSPTSVSRILIEHIHSTGNAHKTRRKMKSIDEDMRSSILYERKVNGFSQWKIAAIVGTSRATVSRILKSLREDGSLGPKRTMKERQNHRKKQAEDSLRIESQFIADTEGIIYDHDPSSLQALLLLHAGGVH